MLKEILRMTILCSIVAVVGPSTMAHNLDIEDQILEKVPLPLPADDARDFSFETPYKVKDVLQSLAVFAYLAQDDVDVYTFQVTREDIQSSAPMPFIVSASALPPACLETQNNYPVTALVGPASDPDMPWLPGLPIPSNDQQLPFQVPTGMGVIVADNPVVKDKAREIFDLDMAEPDLKLGIGWFLPDGLTQKCLLENPAECNFSNTINQPIFIPGTYWIVIWDPSRKEQDYTANIGFSERNTVPNEEVEDIIRDNGHLHTPCHDPAKESFCLAVSKSPDRSNSRPLEGKVLSDDVYIFLKPAFPDSDIERVKFCLDCTLTKTERFAPYDLRGTFDSMEAAPLDTEDLSNGHHTVRAEITFGSGAKLSLSSDFFIANPVDDSDEYDD